MGIKEVTIGDIAATIAENEKLKLHVKIQNATISSLQDRIEYFRDAEQTIESLRAELFQAQSAVVNAKCNDEDFYLREIKRLNARISEANYGSKEIKIKYNKLTRKYKKAMCRVNSELGFYSRIKLRFFK